MQRSRKHQTLPARIGRWWQSMLGATPRPRPAMVPIPVTVDRPQVRGPQVRRDG